MPPGVRAGTRRTAAGNPGDGPQNLGLNNLIMIFIAWWLQLYVWLGLGFKSVRLRASETAVPKPTGRERTRRLDAYPAPAAAARAARAVGC